MPTLSSFLSSSFEGAQGTTGAGTQGTQGIQGIQGSGIQGSTGSGSQGTQGTQGLFGLQGTSGVNYTKGVDTYTATEGQTTFASNYSIGFVDVYLNGVRLSESEYTATNGTSIVLGLGASAGDVIDIISYTGGVLGAQGIQGIQGIQGVQGNFGPQGTAGVSFDKNSYSHTATSGQTTFSATYTVGFAEVYLNGVRLSENEYTATNGTSIVLGVGASVDDIVDIITYTGGVLGSQGVQGTQGGQGIQGLDGQFAGIGVQGTQGTQGIQGDLGTQGTVGAGTQGTQGIQGTTGTQGTLGTQGTSGSSVTLSNDTSTNATRYVVFEDTTSGTVTTVNVSSSGLTFNPSTGRLTSTELYDSSGSMRTLPQISTSSRTLIATDTGKHISATSTVTVPYNVFSTGDVVTIYNNSSSSITISQGSSVTLRQSGTSNTGSRTLAQYGVATVLCVAGSTSSVFVISGSGLT